ncbi:MAG: low molecular weight phosphotyrosine protein phosphatase [Candidatus Obscuribacterales bacterium]|nr:low molecular weight phosphotyrosine protein phosphatase [Candidatus Obscuribacterales bacterium]
MNLLFVCLGNICRSPMAAGIMQRIYEIEKLNGTIDSCGTMDWNAGNCADPRAIAVARSHGIDLSAHRARQITIADFETFDIIYAMDNANAISLRKIAPSRHKHKIRLIGGADEVIDPYHSNESAFRETYRMLDEYCRNEVRKGFKSR